MAERGELLVSLESVVKDYRALRPLRVERLDLYSGESVAVLGFDQGAAEVLVNLVAGATLPDTGEVRVFGRATSAITDGETWLKGLDALGIISERALLLDQLTVEQNLAVPLSLELYDLPQAVRDTVARLARETGIGEQDLPRFVSTLTPLNRMRLRLGRALAIGPQLVMAEHPNASLPPEDVAAFAADLSRVASGRRIGMLVATADARFAESVGHRVLKLNPATGALSEVRTGWRGWFS